MNGQHDWAIATRQAGTFGGLGMNGVVNRSTQKFFATPAQKPLSLRVHVNTTSIHILHIQTTAQGFSHTFVKLALLGKLVLGSLAFSDVGADRHVAQHLARVIQKRNDGRIDPIEAAVLAPVFDFAVPDLAVADGGPHGLEKIVRVVARVKQAMVLPQQLLAAIEADLTEFVVGIGDLAAAVGDADNGMRIQRIFLKFKFAQRTSQVAPCASQGGHGPGHISQDHHRHCHQRQAVTVCHQLALRIKRTVGGKQGIGFFGALRLGNLLGELIDLVLVVQNNRNMPRQHRQLLGLARR